MQTIQGTIKKTERLPDAFFLYREEDADKYIIFQFQGNQSVGVQWNSEISAPPKIKEFPTSDITMITLGQHVIVISIIDGIPKLILPLHQQLEEVLDLEQIIVLIMETMLINISKTNYAINSFLEFPDVIDGWHVVENRIKIIGISGKEFWLDI